MSVYFEHKVEERKQEPARRSLVRRDRSRDLAIFAEVLPREAVHTELFISLYWDIELHLTHAVELDTAKVELREDLNNIAQSDWLIQSGTEIPQSRPG